MALNIQKLSSNKPFARKIMIYGPAGSGKTTLAATIREAGFNPLVIDLDAGSSTLDGSDIDVTVQRKLNELEKVLWLFISKSQEVAGYTALIVDGLSEAARRELQEITTLAAKNAEGSKKPRDQDVAQLADYGTRNNRLLRVIRLIRDIPGVPVIVTAWSKMKYPEVPNEQGKMVEDKDAKPTEIAPDFSDSLQQVIAGSFDDVHYLYRDKEKNQYRLYTADHDNVRAKTRNGAFADLLTTEVSGKRYPVLVGPNMKTIVEAYRQAMKQQTPQEQAAQESK